MVSETEQVNWKVESAVAITEKKDRSESFGPFDPFVSRSRSRRTRSRLSDQPLQTPEPRLCRSWIIPARRASE